jgi:hypothetical protein
MWLYLVALVLAILGIGGGIASGGIFLIVLLPLAILALIAAVLLSGAGALSGMMPRRRTGVDPLPSSDRAQGGEVPTSPERLTDARRAEQ